MPRTRTGSRVLLALTVALALVAVDAAVAGAAAPAPTTTTTVASPPSITVPTDEQIALKKITVERARIDAAKAAKAYTKAEADLAKTDARVKALEARIPRIQARVDALKKLLEERAAVLYRGGEGGGLAMLEAMSQGDMLGSGRAARLADAANENTGAQMKNLADSRDQLVRNRRDLKNTKARQQKLVADANRRSQDLRASLARSTTDLQVAQATQAYVRYILASAREHAAAIDDGNTPGSQEPAANPLLAAFIPATAMVCPINGPVAFSDDWGQPRSGGRLHQGNDIFALRGTPDVAVNDGVIKQSHNKLGGNAMWLYDVHGNAYYYAHLDSYAGLFNANEMRVVKKGEVIGYVGNTGNAAGGPTHTHFEIHPGNIGPVDPYQILRWICAPQLGLK
jgi:murein DD-endopeptidase MepM/ murein hydrolase activator NlpD